jgi:hypothetical protein
VKDRVQEIKDRLAQIASQDTKLVVETNRAVRRMAELGLTTADVRMFLGAVPTDDYPAMEIDGIPSGGPHNHGFHGFESRQQASLAAWAGMSKKDWPAALQAGHERTNTLLKNQAPEAQGGGLDQIIMIPMMTVVDEGPMVKFRRLKSGKLKELNPEGIIDVQAEEEPAAELLAAMEEAK